MGAGIRAAVAQGLAWWCKSRECWACSTGLSARVIGASSDVRRGKQWAPEWSGRYLNALAVRHNPRGGSPDLAGKNAASCKSAVQGASRAVFQLSTAVQACGGKKNWFADSCWAPQTESTWGVRPCPFCGPEAFQPQKWSLPAKTARELGRPMD